MKRIFVVPTSGLIVRDPQDSYRPIPEAGKVVLDGTYWQRRTKSGDVKLTTESVAEIVE